MIRQFYLNDVLYFPDALVYFCTELSKDCLDVPLENIHRVLSNDLKYLTYEECNQIDSYVSKS